MWIEMLTEVMGSWVGVASVVVILLSALAIPAGIIWALLVRYKGPMELAHEPREPAPARRRHVHAGRRYAH